ncbi:ABC transporter substrate-binding protein [Amorphus coralli]|uniref:ABC transporter substrate-binding protein n=1 Tax=Amorphus coralli TaxID=340680 RepID=UPI000415E8F4|nr:ABC transporter substrate-binding protein [Amorphus coralli]
MKSTALAATLGAVLVAGAAQADPIKVGFISTFSGPAAFSGDYAKKGVELFMKENPDAFGDHEIQIIERDDTGPNPEVAKRLAQELIVQDDVDVIMGIQFSNNAFAILDVANEAEVPVIIFNAATSSITEASPYVVRVSRTMWQSSYPLGAYAHDKLGLTKIATFYADYAPGKDASAAFTEGFEKAGGEIVDAIPLPFPQTPDFTPFLQRIKASGADGVFAFMPSGPYSTAFVKTYVNLGLKESVKLIGPGDIAPPAELDKMGEGIEDAIITFHYSAAVPGEANAKFLKAWNAAYPDTPVDAFAVQAYDGMAALAEAVKKTNGDFDADSFVDALKGWEHDSARGPITIDPETRDVIGNQYVLTIVKNDAGKLEEKLVDTLEAVKDPWKEMHSEQKKN